MSMTNLTVQRRPPAAALLVLSVVLAACGAPGAETPAYCDGISAEMGGCDPDRPAFSATDCDGIAREFGLQLDARTLAIIDGPESAEESKATRVGALTSTASALANNHIRELGLIADCNAEDFVTAAETQFSDAFRAQAGAYLYDGTTVDYATWRAELVNLLAILDVQESLDPS